MGAIARTGNPLSTDSSSNRISERAPHANEDATILGLTDLLGAFMWQADPISLEIAFVTNGVAALTGHDVSEWIGGPAQWGRMIDPEDRNGLVRCMSAVAADGRDREVEFRITRADGSTLWFRDVVRLVDDGSGTTELWGMAKDITSDKVAEAKARASDERYERLTVRTAELKRQTLEDALTGLPNRALLDDRLQMALRSAKRNGSSCGVLVIDLDRFKEINDTHGHHTGDEVLRQVALRLRVSLRGQDTPARTGGDEFVVVLPDTDTEGAVRAAQRILRAFEPPIEVGGRSFAVGLSIGIAVRPIHGNHAEELLGRADDAMYLVKENGGGFGLSLREDDGIRLPRVGARRGRERRHRTGRRRLRQMFFGGAAGLPRFSGARAARR